LRREPGRQLHILAHAEEVRPVIRRISHKGDFGPTTPPAEEFQAIVRVARDPTATRIDGHF
jgi:hypothetical protein